MDPTSPQRRRDSTHRHSTTRRTSNSRRHSTSRRQSGAGISDTPPEDREQRRHRRESSHGHRRPSEDRENREHRHHRRRSSATATQTPVKSRATETIRQTPYTPSTPQFLAHDPMLEAGAPSALNSDLGRKKSLVRPERRANNPEAPDYYYRQHARDGRMDVMPSATGRDADNDGDEATVSSGSTAVKERDTPPRREKSTRDTPKKLQRKGTANREERDEEKQRRSKQEKKVKEASGTPTLWGTYCHLITFWCPNIFLGWAGMKQREQQRAWREKMGLISIILLIMLFVGFLTFGFTQTVCPAGGPTRLRVNKVGDGYMIFHGQAYDLTQSHHPLARGIAAGGNVLWDMDVPHGGQDGSFLFQSVNGACKDLITAKDGGGVPVDNDGNLAWYFPCNTFNQDGSSNAEPNMTDPYYFGYGCHTSKNARTDFYGLRSSGDVFFTWDDVRNTSRNLMVYSGDVLDLDLLKWFNNTQISYPSMFDQIRENDAVKGVDVTLAFANGGNKKVAQCFQEIIKVGSIDTMTVGCIASKVVLYVSLIFILGIVAVKFAFALLFQWFLCRRFAASKTSMSSDKKKRQQQIEEWTDDIYRPAPKMTDPASSAGVGGGMSERGMGNGNGNRRTSFMPTTSRFTSPYAIDVGKGRPAPTTMASQQSTARLLGPSSGAGLGMSGGNRSEMTLLNDGGAVRTGSVSDGRSGSMMLDSNTTPTQARYSSVMATESSGMDLSSGPQGFIHEAVVPQPPMEWQPFGYPLAHAICLVTAYSEGPEGIRTTLDSIAMTDYPNSHKLILVICDGLIKGKGESMSTPEACLGMMRDHAVHPEDVQAFSYVAVASGSKRHNMAKIYSGFYDYGRDSIIPLEKQQRVPMVCVVKCGTPAEVSASKPGNRGKRDSQIILMSFLQKVMFDERMTELEYEMFNGIWKITGISPDFYEIVLMVDADTKVFPDSLTHMISAMVKDPEIMGLCGETKIANKTASWVSMIQVFEYFISHHQSKSFESVFGGVTCLPGCFCMYRIKTPKGGQNYWVPILANPDIVEHYSENVVDTLHKKNLLLLGEDRYLSTLMLKTFPKRKQVFVPQAVCKTTVPDTFKVLLSQRRRWINSTVHNLMELVLVRDLCGTFCFSMQFVVFIELVGTLVLPAAIAFTVYLIIKSIVAAVTHTVIPTIPLILLALILGLPGVLIVVTAHRIVYVAWMLIYLLSLPIWNFVLPTYAYWHFDDFSWGDTRKQEGEVKGAGKAGHEGDGEFDSSKITMKRWGDFEQERRLRGPYSSSGYRSGSPTQLASTYGGSGHERKPSNLGQYSVAEYRDYP
ncbi:Chitin synthase, class 3 [Elasticomyces elasticus]|nr:Chitin synthase, class 3 [Elasticomyces elasticus]KAK3655950.1 Chitin synthase, class 3 [Elasticomyces elasticus]KAK4921449.1 Chitin synthase, class 3 [Elasticomyces elasticus]KAK5760079.1 Chitin synthase, class 3 [Elasticomyces elasticus]